MFIFRTWLNTAMSSYYQLLTKLLSISLSVGVHTNIARCMSPTKHQNASASHLISHNTGASKSLMPCVYLQVKK